VTQLHKHKPLEQFLLNFVCSLRWYQRLSCVKVILTPVRYSFESVSEISASRIKRISYVVISASTEYHKRSDASEMVNSTNFSMCGGRSEPEEIALIVTIRKRIQYRASIQHSLFTTPT
jgi:hypothetical protein